MTMLLLFNQFDDLTSTGGIEAITSDQRGFTLKTSERYTDQDTSSRAYTQKTRDRKTSIKSKKRDFNL